jgi:NtrC-family two-component system response regulator AlgB
LVRIRSYPWPGNIRELRNTVERSVILAREDVVDDEHFPAAVPSDSDEDASAGADITIDELEEAHIRKILGKASSLDAAAKTLGIDPATLYRKRKRLSL